MEITILDVRNEKNGLFVSFSTEIGSAVGVWKSVSLPKIGNLYNVEFDTDEVLSWGRNVTPSVKEETLIEKTEAAIILQGKLEAVERDSELNIIRLGDSVFMFSCGNIPDFIDKYISIKINFLLIFDQNY